MSLAYRGSRGLARLLLWPFTRLWVSGAEHLPAPNVPCLFAANHISHFDPLFLSFAVERQLDYMTTAEFFFPALVGAWMRAVGAFPVNRAGPGGAAIREATRRLRAGRAVGMFPEGGIRAEVASILEGAPGRPGVGRLAVLAGAPVMPCVVLGTDRLYDSHRWRQPFFERVPVWVGFGRPILPGEWGAPGASVDLFGERVREVYARMKTEFRLRPEDLPTTPQRRMAHF